MTGEITVRETQLRVEHLEAQAALKWVMNEPAIKARARLRFGPGRTCEQLARLVDKAIVKAEESGLDTAGLVVSVGNAAPAEDIVRVRRKAHGLSDWISSKTSDVTIILRPEGAGGAPAVPTPSAPPAAPIVVSAEPETDGELAIREVLYGVLDPDLGVNIVDLGFVRRIKVDEEGQATVTMTLTSPACPLAKVMTNQMRTLLAQMNPEFKVEWEWQPSWRPDDISPAGRAQLEAIGFNAFSGEGKGCFRPRPSHPSNGTPPGAAAGRPH